MMASKISNLHFLGILANVNEKICKLQLDNDLSFRIYSYEKLEEILLCLCGDGYQYSTEYDYLYNYFEVVGRQEKYVVITGNVNGREDIDRYITEVVDKYLLNLIDKIRLYKVGNIKLVWYCIHDEIEDQDLGNVDAVSSHCECKIVYPVDDTICDISDEDIEELQTFITEVILPLPHEYIQLTYDIYHKTYEIIDVNLSFLVCMIGIELLLNPSNYEVTYRISRNTAVLIGKDRENAIDIFKMMKKLYGLRSRIVHGNLLKAENKDELHLLRYYLSEAIKQVIKLNKKRDELLSELNILGFGEKHPQLT